MMASIKTAMERMTSDQDGDGRVPDVFGYSNHRSREHRYFEGGDCWDNLTPPTVILAQDYQITSDQNIFRVIVL